MDPVIPSTAVTPAIPSLLIWPPSRWPALDKELWRMARAGHGPEGPDNPAAGSATSHTQEERRRLWPKSLLA